LKKEVLIGHTKEKFGLSIKCCTDAPLLVECGAAVWNTVVSQPLRS
jgi:hypothetical protein